MDEETKIQSVTTVFVDNTPAGEGIIKASGLLMAASVITAVSELGREAVIAALFGAGAASDALFAALALPLLLITISYTALRLVFIPMYARYLVGEDGKGAQQFASAALKYGLAFLGPLSIIGILTSPAIISLVAPGFGPLTVQLAVRLSRFLFPSSSLIILAGIFICILNSHKRFFVPALAPAVRNTILIVILVAVGVRYGVISAAVAFLLGGGAQLIFVAAVTFKEGFRYRPPSRASRASVRQLAIQMMAPLIAIALSEGARVFERSLASFTGVGGVAALSYAQRLTTGLHLLVANSVFTAILPFLSLQSAQGDLREVKQSISLAIRVVALILIPMTATLIVLNVPITRLLFQRGAFDVQATQVTARLIGYYALGLFAMGVWALTLSVFYALRDVLTPLLHEVAIFAIGVALYLAFQRYLGLDGIALAYATTIVLAAISIYLLLYCKVGSLESRQLLVFLVKVGLAGVVMGLIMAFVHLRLPVGEASILACLLAVGFSTVAGLIAFTSLLLAFKVDEVRHLAKVVQSRGLGG